MQYTTLGKTGLRVSVAGLGCGGNSRLGMKSGATMAESVALVREAMDLGVNFLDTAEAYGTEGIVGEAIKAVPRDTVYVSTKSQIRQGDGVKSAAEVIASLDKSLTKLQTDYVDVFHFHAVRPVHYDHALNELAPALLREKEKGKLRHLGITETGPRDPGQETLQRAVHDPCWEVMMLAFHMMNQNARAKVFPMTQKNGIGTLLMFVVRNIFSQPDLLARTVRDLVAEGRLSSAFADSDSPLNFLVHEGGATSTMDAAYRFARHEPGADVVLFGTGKVAHLRANIDSILKPALPPADVEKLHAAFGELQGVGLDLPDHVKP